MALINRFLPRYQFVERHRIAIAAEPRRVWDAMRARDILNDDPVVRAMMALRRAPAALWQMVFATDKPTITTFGTHSFTPLGLTDSEVVTGLVGRFWRPSGGLRTIADADAFLGFAEAGTPKLALNFACTPRGTGTMLTTETRVFCPDIRARILFTPYWLAIRPGSGFVRKRYLRAVKRLAEGGQTTGRAAADKPAAGPAKAIAARWRAARARLASLGARAWHVLRNRRRLGLFGYRLAASTLALAFRPLAVLRILRSERHAGAIRPWIIENLLFPAPLGLGFILALLQNAGLEFAGLVATMLFLLLAWGIPRLSALLIAWLCGDSYRAVLPEQTYLLFLGSVPAFYFFFDQHASWIAIDILSDGLQALSYDPQTLFIVLLFPAVVVPVVQIAWAREIGRSVLRALPSVLLLSFMTFGLIEFFWGLADALQNP